MVKNLTATAGDIRDAGLMFGPRRSPGEGHGNLLQYSCLENSMDKKSLEGYRPWLKPDLTVHPHFHWVVDTEELLV